MANGLGIDIWIIHDVIHTAPVLLVTVGTEVERKGFAVCRIEATLEDFGAVRVGKSSVRERCECLNDISETVHGELIIVIEFHKDLSTGETTTATLDLSDHSAVSIASKDPDAVVPISKCGHNLVGGVTRLRVVHDHPLPVRIGLSKEGLVRTEDPLTGLIGGGKDAHEGDRRMGGTVDNTEKAVHHLVCDPHEVGILVLNVDPSPTHFHRLSHENIKLMECPKRSDHMHVAVGQQ
jgi:hypothetical protein